jgi:rod shape-determining protein MreD
MVNFQNIQSWIYYVKYLMICFIILSFQLLPMRIVYQEVLWPNLIYLVTVGWLIRKPSYLPVILILFVHIISDIVLLKPLGLWPALSLIGYEFLRWRSLSQD